ncbi:MAG: Na+/H+ antiporter [Bacteroidota bacterium]
MINILYLEEIAIVLLLIATLVGILARRFRMPYTVGLVVVGAILAIVYQQLDFEIAPQLILGIFVPPLIFEAAFHLPVRELRRNLTPIATLAVVGVLLTTLMVGLIIYLGAGIAVHFAIVFGSMIAATDPVAVIALFRTLVVPRRLQVLLEGESLLNDGTAIVIFNLAVAAAISGDFQLLKGVAEFVRVAGFGLVVGLALGSVTSLLISRVNDYLIETAITFVLAYGTYLVAEAFHVSGVLAVLAAGLVNGNTGPSAMSATTRIVVFNFWEFMSFLANSFVFLMIGLVVDIPLLTQNWRAILWGILAALLARLIVIYGLFPGSRSIPTSWKHIMYWGGLRGAIPLALALSLPMDLPASVGQLRAMVFGLVIFTLLVQGTSMSALIKWLGLGEARPAREEYDLSRARTMTVKSAFEHVQRAHREGLISDRVWSIMSGALDPYLKGLTDAMHDVLEQHPDVEAEELDAAWREFLRHQRTVLTELYRDRTISQDAYSDLSARVDEMLTAPEITWSDAQSLSDSLWSIYPDEMPAAPPAEG